MQPRMLAIIVTFLPFIVSNSVYLLSAYQGFVPWCIPYLDGCTTISRAARSGDSIFLFRIMMMSYGVLLIWYWIYSKHWLDTIKGQPSKNSRIMLGLGVTGAIFLLIYIDYLGTSGEVNRFMRRYGIMIYFVLTPLAQLLLLQQHYKIINTQAGIVLSAAALQYQSICLILMLVTGFISIYLGVTNSKTYETENIIEWNFSLLLTLYYAAMIFIWKDYKLVFTYKSSS